MALSEQSYTITDTTDATYDFTFDWVRVSHINVSLNGVDVPSGDFTITGTSGAATCTLSGTTFSTMDLNDILRIYRVTPNTFAGRTVDFNAEGTVSLAALDDAFEHDISLIQEVIDEITDAIKTSDIYGGNYDAGGFEIRNLGTGTTASSAVTLQQLQGVATASGALPPVDDSFDGHVLGVVSGSWATVSVEALQTLLLLGDAAYRDVTVGHPGGVIDRSLGDARYLQITNSLADLTSPSTARVNLGLGSAAIENAGSGPSDVLKLTTLGDIPSGVGLAPGVDFTGTTVYHKGSGLRDHISIVKLEELFAIAVDNAGVVTNDNFDTNDANTVGLVEVPANLPSFNFRNTSPVEVAVDDVTDGVTLTVDTYELELEVTMFETAILAGERRIGLALYDHTKSVLIEKLNNALTTLEGNEDGAASNCTYKLRALYVVSSSSSDIRVRIAIATGGAAKVVGGYLRAARIA